MHRIARTGAAVAALGLTLAACSSGGSDSGSTDGGSNSSDKLTVGIKFDQPGLGLQQGGDYTGFDVDVARYIAEQLGYSEDQIEFREAPSAQRENLLSNGQVDMIVATYSITDERKQTVDFAGPYFVAGQDLLVAEDSDITGPEDLDGQLLCSVTGSTPAQRIKDDYAGDVQLQEFDGYSECVEALAAGTIDAVTTDDIILAGFAAQDAYAGKLKVVGNPFSEENYGVGLPKDSDMCQDVTDAITAMIDDGTWEKLLDENLGDANYTPNADLNPPTPESCS
ncbi:glutamate ABC transporter substrate-binding protein [Cellulomonas taurus]|jgi:glutamate transport system substrate-binding protein|uniref:glutamate ABC transporter substrate-binding protein n=1 Tax=Cellulomonas taurus TaxID=2729175 RepID=UPI00145CF9E6|nr:glutamate ABC transporter substrate-binding protein [Cellulomonas taurus]